MSSSFRDIRLVALTIGWSTYFFIRYQFFNISFFDTLTFSCSLVLTSCLNFIYHSKILIFRTFQTPLVWMERQINKDFDLGTTHLYLSSNHLYQGTNNLKIGINGLYLGSNDLHVYLSSNTTICTYLPNSIFKCDWHCNIHYFIVDRDEYFLLPLYKSCRTLRTLFGAKYEIAQISRDYRDNLEICK